MFSRLRRRYEAFAERVLASLSEIERQDVRAFDHWFYSERGYLWIVWIFLGTTVVAGAASRLPWNMSFAEAAVLFNVVVFLLLWAGLSAWFGYRKYQGKLLRFVLVTLALVLAGAFAGGTLADLLQGRAALAWLFDRSSLRHGGCRFRPTFRREGCPRPAALSTVAPHPSFRPAAKPRAVGNSPPGCTPA